MTHNQKALGSIPAEYCAFLVSKEGPLQRCITTDFLLKMLRWPNQAQMHRMAKKYEIQIIQLRRRIILKDFSSKQISKEPPEKIFCPQKWKKNFERAGSIERVEIYFWRSKASPAFQNEKKTVPSWKIEASGFLISLWLLEDESRTNRSLFVAQLAEQSVLTSEIPGSNPYIGIFFKATAM